MPRGRKQQGKIVTSRATPSAQLATEHEGVICPKNGPREPVFGYAPRTDGTVAADVRYRVDGKSRTKSFESPEAAERWARIVRHIGPVEALKLLSLDVVDTPTVDEYAERYIASKSGLEGMTVDHYRMYMRVSISDAMGALPLDAVTPEVVAEWINSQVESGYAAKTIANRHGFLSAMFQHAVDVTEILRKNPCAFSNLPNSEREEMVFLSPDEFTELLSFIPARFQPFILFLASTGMRWGEATALRPSDFDITNKTVTVSRAWKKSRAKGWYSGAPKTKRSKRTIALDSVNWPDFRSVFQARMEHDEQEVFAGDA